MKRAAAVPAPWIVVGAVALAVVVNLVVYGIGRMLGGAFVFTSPTGPAEVDALTVAGFSAVPLAIGLTVVAIAGRWWRWVFPAAMVVAPVLELGSILGMTMPADLDPVSTATLAACHVALVPISLAAIAALRSRSRNLATVVPTELAV